ncbi:hypothetical protein yc1106_02226 [Curvularia clavata]|uniref:Uncharacterized protein n=1 Tax=Curvularia clavata TaxID=95742 RepID=A0A9Q8Z2F1_CURCL|nr:hypothetical protein yc1106_02226 [Curvularia clavata]
MYDYGRGGRVTNNKIGYTAEVSVKKREEAHYCCLINGLGTCRGNCQYWDTCNWDWNTSHNCDKYRCGLCPGGKQFCGPDKKRRDFLISDEVGNTTTHLENEKALSYDITIKLKYL